ncbi:filaggrin-2-like [Saccostrea echinata]|uniref:filaggrin-2-like n=1 Tax=Saccostrea echinata TaxID=191078 RepID=UPI002A8285D8|nr:filaggrin-2-like [Saccostrea echinata]
MGDSLEDGNIKRDPNVRNNFHNCQQSVDISRKSTAAKLRKNDKIGEINSVMNSDKGRHRRSKADQKMKSSLSSYEQKSVLAKVEDGYGNLDPNVRNNFHDCQHGWGIGQGIICSQAEKKEMQNRRAHSKEQKKDPGHHPGNITEKNSDEGRHRRSKGDQKMKSSLSSYEQKSVLAKVEDGYGNLDPNLQPSLKDGDAEQKGYSKEQKKDPGHHPENITEKNSDKGRHRRSKADQKMKSSLSSYEQKSVLAKVEDGYGNLDPNVRNNFHDCQRGWGIGQGIICSQAEKKGMQNRRAHSKEQKKDPGHHPGNITEKNSNKGRHRRSKGDQKMKSSLSSYEQKSVLAKVEDGYGNLDPNVRNNFHDCQRGWGIGQGIICSQAEKKGMQNRRAHSKEQKKDPGHHPGNITEKNSDEGRHRRSKGDQKMKSSLSSYEQKSVLAKVEDGYGNLDPNVRNNFHDCQRGWGIGQGIICSQAEKKGNSDEGRHRRSKGDQKMKSSLSSYQQKSVLAKVEDGYGNLDPNVRNNFHDCQHGWGIGQGIICSQAEKKGMQNRRAHSKEQKKDPGHHPGNITEKNSDEGRHRRSKADQKMKSSLSSYEQKSVLAKVEDGYGNLDPNVRNNFHDCQHGWGIGQGIICSQAEKKGNSDEGRHRRSKGDQKMKSSLSSYQQKSVLAKVEDGYGNLDPNVRNNFHDCQRGWGIGQGIICSQAEKKGMQNRRAHSKEQKKDPGHHPGNITEKNSDEGRHRRSKGDQKMKSSLSSYEQKSVLAKVEDGYGNLDPNVRNNFHDCQHGWGIGQGIICSQAEKKGMQNRRAHSKEQKKDPGHHPGNITEKNSNKGRHRRSKGDQKMKSSLSSYEQKSVLAKVEDGYGNLDPNVRNNFHDCQRGWGIGQGIICSQAEKKGMQNRRAHSKEQKKDPGHHPGNITEKNSDEGRHRRSKGDQKMKSSLSSYEQKSVLAKVEDGYGNLDPNVRNNFHDCQRGWGIGQGIICSQAEKKGNSDEGRHRRSKGDQKMKSSLSSYEQKSVLAKVEDGYGNLDPNVRNNFHDCQHGWGIGQGIICSQAEKKGMQNRRAHSKEQKKDPGHHPGNITEKNSDEGRHRRSKADQKMKSSLSSYEQKSVLAKVEDGYGNLDPNVRNNFHDCQHGWGIGQGIICSQAEKKGNSDEGRHRRSKGDQKMKSSLSSYQQKSVLAKVEDGYGNLDPNVRNNFHDCQRGWGIGQGIICSQAEKKGMQNRRAHSKEQKKDPGHHPGNITEKNSDEGRHRRSKGDQKMKSSLSSYEQKSVLAKVEDGYGNLDPNVRNNFHDCQHGWGIGQGIICSQAEKKGMQNRRAHSKEQKKDPGHHPGNITEKNSDEGRHRRSKGDQKMKSSLSSYEQKSVLAKVEDGYGNLDPNVRNNFHDCQHGWGIGQGIICSQAEKKGMQNRRAHSKEQKRDPGHHPGNITEKNSDEGRHRRSKGDQKMKSSLSSYEQKSVLAKVEDGYGNLDPNVRNNFHDCQHGWGIGQGIICSQAEKKGMQNRRAHSKEQKKDPGHHPGNITEKNSDEGRHRRSKADQKMKSSLSSYEQKSVLAKVEDGYGYLDPNVRNNFHDCQHGWGIGQGIICSQAEKKGMQNRRAHSKEQKKDPGTQTKDDTGEEDGYVCLDPDVGNNFHDCQHGVRYRTGNYLQPSREKKGRRSLGPSEARGEEESVVSHSAAAIIER